MYIDNDFVQKYDHLIKSRLDAANLTIDQFDNFKSKIYERILESDNYDPNRGALTTWLYNICRSVISNELKKEGRSQDALDQEVLDLDSIHNKIGPEDAGDPRDEIDRLFKSITVSPRDEEIMRAVHLQGATPEEIAQEYELKITAVYKILARTMKALRQVAEA